MSEEIIPFQRQGQVKTHGATWGFITGEDGDYFFHDSDVLGDIELAVGDRVSFEIVEPTPIKGPRARGVAFLSAGNSAQEATR